MTCVTTSRTLWQCQHDDLLAALEKASGRDLSWGEQWLKT